MCHLFISYLHPVSHFYKGTSGVESPCSTGVQVGAIIVVHNLHIVHTVRLKHTDTEEEMIQMMLQSIIYTRLTFWYWYA